MTATRMRPIQQTISLDEARAIIDGAAAPLGRTERLSLSEANGRVVSGDVVARTDVPPFARAAMDGYAVRSDDTTGAGRDQPRVLQRIEIVYTGQIAARRVGPGECIEIATGAPLPSGADAVVMVEDTEQDAAGAVRIFSPATPLQHVGRQAADIAAGQVILRTGAVLNSARIGALAATGLLDVEVFGRPRVAIMSTGNELAEAGRPLTPGKIYDVNRYTLTAIVQEHGGVPVTHPSASDTLADLSEALEPCLSEDLVAVSGGSSVGERDLILDAIAARGKVLFHGIAVKPGRPTVFGVIDGKPVFGMPGYPTSCLSNAHILLVPLLRKMAHLPPQRLRTLAAPLAADVVSTRGRHQFYTVRIVEGSAVPAYKESGDITSMSEADGYIEIPAAVEFVPRGTVVDVRLF
jgi:molybdopterin molybdotransferase